MAFPPRRAANTPSARALPRLHEGARRKAVPASRRRLTADRPKKAGSSTRRAGHPMEKPSVGCPARVLECR